MMQRSMYTYAWDLRDEGVIQVTDRLRAAGLNAVSLATSYHAGRFLRPHSPGGKVYFPEDGTIYFQPDLSRYGRIRPRVAKIVDEFDALRALERAAPDLAKNGWAVGLHNTRLGLTQPDLTARTVFGDPMFNSLCPSHPDVQEYLVSLCADLGTNYDVTEIIVETPGWQAFRHGHHHEFEMIALSEQVETMMGMCFCDACRARALAQGIDFDGLMRATRRELEHFFADGTEPGTDPESDPDWQAFHAWRARVVTGLVAELRDTLDQRVKLAIIPTVQTPNALCWREGSDLAQLADAADRLEVPAYQTGVANIMSDVRDVVAKAGAHARIGYILRPCHPHLATAQAVRDVVEMLGAADARSVSFYNYGHMRLQSLEWIKAALN